MKAVLTFDLSDIDDQYAHKRAIKSLDMALALNSIYNRIRDTVKHDRTPITMEEFSEILSTYGVNLDDLVY